MSCVQRKEFLCANEIVSLLSTLRCWLRYTIEIEQIKYKWYKQINEDRKGDKIKKFKMLKSGGL